MAVRNVSDIIELQLFCAALICLTKVNMTLSCSVIGVFCKGTYKHENAKYSFFPGVKGPLHPSNIGAITCFHLGICQYKGHGSQFRITQRSLSFFHPAHHRSSVA